MVWVDVELVKLMTEIYMLKGILCGVLLVVLMCLRWKTKTDLEAFIKLEALARITIMKRKKLRKYERRKKIIRTATSIRTFIFSRKHKPKDRAVDKP